jgi:hypothetical protein
VALSPILKVGEDILLIMKKGYRMKRMSKCGGDREGMCDTIARNRPCVKKQKETVQIHRHFVVMPILNLALVKSRPVQGTSLDQKR